jgi:voltage-gated potassium channel
MSSESAATLDAPRDRISPYQLFMLALCGWALLLLAAATFVRLDDSTRTILNYADYAVCFLFLLDFLNSLWRAEHRWRYMRTWGWIDLLSSIPTVDALRWGRAVRVMRILRVLRLIKSARTIVSFVVGKRAQSAFLAAILLSLLLLVSASIAILQFEVPAGGNIVSAEDAMWWAVTTMTTVGYGDRYPITSEGRLIAVFLMASGVGLFGTMSGLVASWFLAPAAKEADNDLVEIKRLLVEMKDREGR